jgi:UDP-N-acetyl-D-mannosaminuronic acid dehydrogenase
LNNIIDSLVNNREDFLETVCVMGLGYIGLPTACMLANNGYRVLGIDVDDQIINKLNSGKPHLDEPELEGIFIRAFSNKRLVISKNVRQADIFIISVPTPLGKDNKAELKYVKNATHMIKDYIRNGNTVILESTSPPGTTENIVDKIIYEHTGLKSAKDYYLAFCPERVLPGKLIYELVHNDRVIGGINKESAEKAKEIYRSFSKGNIYITDLKTAEFVKLAENTYRDVNIAFSNELLMLCRDYGIDIWDVIEIANRHPRVNILTPGPGVGGHCIPIDPWFILEGSSAKDTLIEKAREVNDRMPGIVSDIAIGLLKKINDPKITILGASYKENVDDTRESPTIKLVEILKKRGLSVAIYDPVASCFKYELSSLDDSLKGSDLLILMVGHSVFKDIDFSRAAGLMRNRKVLDTRNFYKCEYIESHSFKYFAI